MLWLKSKTTKINYHVHHSCSLSEHFHHIIFVVSAVCSTILWTVIIVGSDGSDAHDPLSEDTSNVLKMSVVADIGYTIKLCIKI
jgi:hypothetical protein